MDHSSYDGLSLQAVLGYLISHMADNIFITRSVQNLGLRVFLFKDISFNICVKVTQSYLTLLTPWTVAHQASLSMGFSRQEYWSGFPCPLSGVLPDPGINPGLVNCRQILYYLSHWGLPWLLRWWRNCLQFMRPGFNPWVGKNP